MPVHIAILLSDMSIVPDYVLFHRGSSLCTLGSILHLHTAMYAAYSCSYSFCQNPNLVFGSSPASRSCCSQRTYQVSCSDPITFVCPCAWTVDCTPNQAWQAITRVITSTTLFHESDSLPPPHAHRQLSPQAWILWLIHRSSQSGHLLTDLFSLLGGWQNATFVTLQ